VVFDDPPAPNAAESPPEAWSGVMLRSLDWQQFGDTRCAIGDWPITEADATTISSRTGASSSGRPLLPHETRCPDLIAWRDLLTDRTSAGRRSISASSAPLRLHYQGKRGNSSHDASEM
jgi:hypothetical protein